MARKHLGGSGYLLVWVLLLVCTTTSFGVSRLSLPEAWAITVALAIAALKSTLVLLFFMHLIEQRATARLVIVVSVLLIVLLVGLTAADVATRHT